MKYFILLSALLPTMALADFSGNWEGVVTARDGRGLEIPCELKMEIKQDGNRIAIMSHEMECSFFSKKWQGVTQLENRDGKLFFVDPADPQNSGEIGTVSDSEMAAVMSVCSYDMQKKNLCAKNTYARWVWTLGAQGLQYSEVWFRVVNGKEVKHIALTGTVKNLK